MPGSNTRKHDQDQARKNARVTVLLVGFVACMVGVSFAAVPLYDLFCRVTGYGGTPQQAAALPEKIVDRAIRIRFNADKASDLPWEFAPAQTEVMLQVGESGLAFYKARNNAQVPVTGMAVFNVTPLKAGQYFTKIECFCFTEQVLAGGQEADMPVSFFVDPAFAADPAMDDVRTITLSYTFYNQSEGGDEQQLSVLDEQN